MSNHVRILGTGSRNLTAESYDKIVLLLRYAYQILESSRAIDSVTLVHGGAYGFDRLAERAAIELGWVLEPHYADWDHCGSDCSPGHQRTNSRGKKYCPLAGPRRNREMVASGADVCVSMPLGKSSGTRDCMKQALDAGIRVIELTSSE